MQKNPIHITQEFKYNDIIKIIDIMKKNNFDLKTIPVVDSEENMMLIGCVSPKILEVAIIHHLKQFNSIQEDHHKIKKPRDRCIIPIQSTNIQLLEKTPLYQVHMLFITMYLKNAFVTKNGRLIGIVTRSALKEIISKNK